MKALILNSGMGRRMGTLTASTPKCLVALNDRETLFSRQIRLLQKSGINTFVITTGHKDDVLRDYAKTEFPEADFVFVHNEDFETTNYIVSLNRAADRIEDDVLLLHGDLYFQYQVLERVAASERSCVVVDSTLPLPEKDFKARTQKDRVVAISTRIFGSNCVACQPLYKLLKQDWLLWKNRIEAFCAAGRTDVYAEDALNTVTGTFFLAGMDIKGAICLEIDNLEDMEKVKRLHQTR